MIDIHDFNNAVEVLKKIQPDLIYIVPHVEFISLAFSHAANFLGIPTAGLVMFGFGKELTLKSNFFSNLRKFFNNSVPTDVYVNKTSFLRRIRFILFKLEFMRKTFSSLNMNLFQVFMKVKEILFLSFSKNPFYNQLPLSKHFVLNSFQKTTLMKFGFDEKNIIITGHPMFDLALQENFKKQNGPRISLNILFAPDTLAESGIWPLQRQNHVIQKILKELKSIPNSFIKIKIHPASANIIYYQSIIDKTTPNASVFKDGSIESYLKDSDVVVVYSPYSTSLIYALIYRIPIIFCNFYDDLDDIFNLVKSRIAIECKNSVDISKLITNFNEEKFETNRNNYIKNYLFSDDGKSSKRIALEILNLIKEFKK